MAKYKHKLPSVPNPEGDKCYPLFVPDHPDYMALLLRQLRQLTNDRMYMRDDDKTALVVRNQWLDRMLTPFVEAVSNGDECSDCDDDKSSCFRMDTTTEALTFYPNDPFTDKDNQIGEKIASQLRWMRWGDLPINSTQYVDILGDLIGSLYGYFDNDVILAFDTIEILNPLERLGDLIEQVTNFPFPYIITHLQGSGQFEIKFLKFPLGCSVVLIPDLEVSLQNLWDTIVDYVDNDGDFPQEWVFIDLNLDTFVGIPETTVNQIVEFNFDEDTEHTVHCYFIPFKLEFPFIFPFGGIREIEACDNIEIIGSQSGDLINVNNYARPEYNRKGVIPVGTTEDFYDALIRYETEKANRWLLGYDPSNIKNDVTISHATGETTTKDSQSGIDPIDGTTQELHYGGVYEQATQFAKLISDTNANITNLYSESTIINLTKLFANPFDVTTWGTLIGQYVTADPQITVNVTALALKIFCFGYSNGVLAYALANHGANEEAVNFLVQFAAEISASQWNTWYEKGSLIPKLGYTSASCYKYDPVELTITTANFSTSPIAWITNGMAHRKLRVEVTVVAPFVDASNKKFDGVYLQPNGGSASLSNAIRIYNAPAQTAADSYPAYLNGAGKYTMEYTAPNTVTGTIFYPTFSYTPISGEIRIKIYDLGAY